MRPASALLGVLALSLTAGLACDAGFTDLRPPRADVSGDLVDPLLDLGGAGDARRGDAAGLDAGADAAGLDAGAPDADAGADGSPDGASGEDAAPSETLVAVGSFEDIMYETTGSAEVWQLADGSYELRFSDDFTTTDALPGPAVALSVNPDISPVLVAGEGDVDLGALLRTSGPQSYALPFAPGPREYAWVWCQPFGIEVARARLEAP